MRTVLIVVLGLWAASSMTQEVEPGGYIGVGIASFDYEESDPDFGTFSDSTNGTKLYGGYRFDESWGFEASWETTGTIEESASVFIPGVGNVSASLGAEFDIITLRGVGFLPLSWGSLFAGLGYFDADADAFAVVNDGFTIIRVEASTSEDGATFLGGAQWDFDSFSLRLEYEWWDISDADASQLGVGLHWRF